MIIEIGDDGGGAWNRELIWDQEFGGIYFGEDVWEEREWLTGYAVDFNVFNKNYYENVNKRRFKMTLVNIKDLNISKIKDKIIYLSFNILISN